jgi:hypothetical protein
MEEILMNLPDYKSNLGPPQLENRFKVVVEFIIESDSVDDAEVDVNDIIQEGILALVGSDEEREPVYEYDIIEAEPAEVF